MPVSGRRSSSIRGSKVRYSRSESKAQRSIYLSQEEDSAKSLITALTDSIQRTRSEGFDHSIRDDKGVVQTLVAYADSDKDPFHERESEIQVLRYLKGMAIIAKHSGNSEILTKAREFHTQLTEAMLENINDPSKTITATYTHALAEKIAKYLEQTLHMSESEARKQVTMARDL